MPHQNQDTLVIKRKLDITNRESSSSAIARVKQVTSGLYEAHWQTVTSTLRHVPALVEVAKNATSITEYRVVIPQDIAGKIRDGTAYLGNKAGGLFSANVHDKKTGKIIKQISLTKKDVVDLAPSLNQLAVQNALADISSRLEVIDQKLNDVLKGQHNDRLAFVDSGSDLYQQALSARHPEHRNNLLYLAAQQLNYGRHSLMREIEAGIAFFGNDEQRRAILNIKFPVGKDVKKIRSEAIQVQKSFQGIIQASYILVWVYGALDEPDIIVSSLLTLNEIAEQFREKGYQIARWLPERDGEILPEHLWSKYTQMALDTVKAGRELKNISQKSLELSFPVDDILRKDKKL